MRIQLCDCQAAVHAILYPWLLYLPTSIPEPSMATVRSVLKDFERNLHKDIRPSHHFHGVHRGNPSTSHLLPAR